MTFSVSITNYTHFNANTPQGQIQLGPHAAVKGMLPGLRQTSLWCWR